MIVLLNKHMVNFCKSIKTLFKVNQTTQKYHPHLLFFLLWAFYYSNSNGKYEYRCCRPAFAAAGSCWGAAGIWPSIISAFELTSLFVTSTVSLEYSFVNFSHASVSTIFPMFCAIISKAVFFRSSTLYRSPKAKSLKQFLMSKEKSIVYTQRFQSDCKS